MWVTPCQFHHLDFFYKLLPYFRLGWHANTSRHLYGDQSIVRVVQVAKVHFPEVSATQLA